MVPIASTRGLSCPCSAMRCCMDGATRRPIVAMSRVRPATASGTRKPRQLVEQFLEDAVELKPEKDLCAEDEKAAFVEGDLEFAFESHHRLRGDNVIAYAEPTFGGSLCKPLAGRQGPKRPDSNKTPAGDGRGSCVEQRARTATKSACCTSRQRPVGPYPSRGHSAPESCPQADLADR